MALPSDEATYTFCGIDGCQTLQVAMFELDMAARGVTNFKLPAIADLP